MKWTTPASGLALGFVLLAAAPVASSRPAAQATVPSLLAAEDQRFSDQVAGKLTALASDLSDDLTFTHANGREQNKAQFLADAGNGQVHVKSMQASARTARIFGNVGLTHEVFTIDIGLDHKLSSISSGVYVLHGGRWQLVAWQSTEPTQTNPLVHPPTR